MKINLIITSIILFHSSVFSQRVVGYYPYWVLSQFQPEEIELDIVTHVIHSFAWANEDGCISSYDGMFGNNMADIVHSGDSKFLLSIGGWGNHEGFETIINHEDLRELFIYNLTSILLLNDYDGVDLDWEFPNSNDDKNNLNLLVSEMDSIFNSINPDWLITMVTAFSKERLRLLLAQPFSIPIPMVMVGVTKRTLEVRPVLILIILMIVVRQSV